MMERPWRPRASRGSSRRRIRGAIVTLRRWASEPLFLQRSVTFCVLVESTATLSAALVSDARTFEIAVPVPDEQERYAYLAPRLGCPLLLAKKEAPPAAAPHPPSPRLTPPSTSG